MWCALIYKKNRPYQKLTMSRLLVIVGTSFYEQVYTGTVYVIDGCATFFLRDRFSLVKKYEVYTGFSQFL